MKYPRNTQSQLATLETRLENAANKKRSCNRSQTQVGWERVDQNAMTSSSDCINGQSRLRTWASIVTSTMYVPTSWPLWAARRATPAFVNIYFLTCYVHTSILYLQGNYTLNLNWRSTRFRVLSVREGMSYDMGADSLAGHTQSARSRRISAHFIDIRPVTFPCSSTRDIVLACTNTRDVYLCESMPPGKYYQVTWEVFAWSL